MKQADTKDSFFSSRTCAQCIAGVHARWAMLGVAGILAQEIVRPDIFW